MLSTNTSLINELPFCYVYNSTSKWIYGFCDIEYRVWNIIKHMRYLFTTTKLNKNTPFQYIFRKTKWNMMFRRVQTNVDVPRTLHIWIYKHVSMCPTFLKIQLLPLFKWPVLNWLNISKHSCVSRVCSQFVTYMLSEHNIQYLINVSIHGVG